MGNINQGDALLFQHPHHFKKFIYLLHGQGGGGLIQNNYLRIVGNCLGDLTHLPLGDRHIPHRLGQIDGHAKLAEQLGRLFLHAALIHDPHGVGGVASQEQIVDDIPLQALVKLLVNHGDSIFQGIFWSGKADFFSI